MKSIDALHDLETFSLLGGPLHRLGVRAGLVRAKTNTFALGLAIGWPLWAVLFVLALIDGHDLRSFEALSAYARLLVVIPLFFFCESVLSPRITEFIGAITRSGVVPARDLPALQAVGTRISRWKEAWSPEVCCFILAIALSRLLASWHIPGSENYPRDFAATDLTMTGWWYQTVCLTVLRFLLFRWAWWLCLWFYLVWQLSRLPLQLRPTHSDGVAGLGNLEVVHMHFLPLVLANSTMLAASFATDISAGTMAFEAVLPAVAVVLLINAVLFVGPLTIFMPGLWACRVKGLSDFMELAERHSREFEDKWLRTDSGGDATVVGSPDISSLADLGSSLGRVRDMRTVPASLRLLATLAGAAVLPMLPLALFKYPLTTLVRDIFTRLTGL